MIADGVLLMGAAWLIEVCFGWPAWLHRRIQHPVVWCGALIGWLDGHMPGSRHWQWWYGVLVGLVVIGASTGFTVIVSATLAPAGWLGFCLEACIASSLLASRSLHEHVARVHIPLATGDLSSARRAVSHIVGRDPAQLDAAGMARATLETLAENASDAVVAPLFWGVLLGLPGLAAYKAINTLDSMIGHRSSRYRQMGCFSARVDDVANWIPARLTGLMIGLSSPVSDTWRVMACDARRHRSPNAGWPEAALAGALNCRLSGPRHYATGPVEEPWLNGDAADPEADDIRRGLQLHRRALLMLALFTGCTTVWLASLG